MVVCKIEVGGPSENISARYRALEMAKQNEKARGRNG